MEIKEIVERQMCQDPRVFNAIQNAKKTDNSFKEKGFLGMPIRYSQEESLVRNYKLQNINQNENTNI